MKANYNKQYRCDNDITRKAYICTEAYLYAAGIAMYEILGYKCKAIYNVLRDTNDEIKEAYNFTEGYAYRLYLETCALQKGFDVQNHKQAYLWMRGGQRNILELVEVALVEALTIRRISKKKINLVLNCLEDKIGRVSEITPVTRERLRKALNSRINKELIVKGEELRNADIH